MPCADEDFALGKENSQDGGKGRNTRTGPEQRTPTGVRNEVQVDDGGDEVSDSVSLLHNTAGETTSLDREILEGGRRGQTPDPSHADTEKTSDGEELMECLNEAGAEGEDRDDKEIGDQRPFPAKSIRDETKGDLEVGHLRDVDREWKGKFHLQHRWNGTTT